MPDKNIDETNKNIDEAKTETVQPETSKDIFEIGAKAFEKKEEDVEKEEQLQKNEQPKKEEQSQKPQEELQNKEIELLKKYKLDKFKKIEDALEAYKNLESAYGKVLSSFKSGQIPEEIQDGILGAKKIVKQPRINVNPPDPTNYIDSDGNIRLQDYIRDTLIDYTLNLQRSLVEGELASALYSIQKEAVLSNFSKLKEEQERERATSQLVDKIYQDYPIFKEDKELEELLSYTIQGAYALKKQPLTEQEILDIAKKVAIKGQTQSQTKEELKPVETLKGSPPLTLEKKKRNKQEEAIDEIFEASQRSRGIF